MPIRPVMFVGLGSTGAKIVSRIYENLELNRDVEPWIKPFYKYLAVTSEAKCEPGVNANLDVFHLALGPLNTRDVIESLRNNTNTQEEFKARWYNNADGTPWIPEVDLGDGVGGRSIFGSTLLQHRSFDLANNLQTKLRSLKQAIEHAKESLPVEEQDNVDINHFDCYVFGLLAGGTCTGTLFDVALLIKSALGTQTNLFAALLLGDVCYDGKAARQLPQSRRFAQHWNTCISLAELSVVLSKTGYDVVKADWPRHIGNIAITDRLFDRPLFNSVTLVGAKNDAGRTFNAGGNQFPKYQLFLAEYFSEFFKSSAAREEIGRTVDDLVGREADIADRPTTRARPNCFARIGYVCVQLPREKILAGLEKEIADVLGVQYLANADPERVMQGENLFLQRIQWALLLNDQQSPFAPPAGVDPMIVADDSCPVTADDFETAWRQNYEQVKNFYVSWMACQSAESAAALNAFGGIWKQTLAELAADYCGQSGKPLSLGSLKKLLEERLIPMIEALIAKVNHELPGVQKQMSDSGSSFESVIEDVKAAFPGKLNFFGRRYWSGGVATAESLSQYRDAVRRYAVLKLLNEALLLLLRELQVMVASRKLITRHAAGKVFASKTERVQEAYRISASEAVKIEVLKEQKDIHDQLITPLLDKTSDGHATFKERVLQMVAAAWAGSTVDGQEGIYAYYLALCDLLRRESGNLDAGNLSARNPYNTTVERIRGMLDTRFTTQCDAVFNGALAELSVWNTIRQYVEQRKAETKQSAESILTGLFKTYMEQASLFTKMNDLQGGDAVEAEVNANHLFYLCNQEDAAKCFTDLGLPNPQTYLNDLMNAAAMGQVSILKAPSGRDRIQLFQQKIGELPYFYAGFEEVASLLSQPPIPPNGTERYWSDARFPAWIAKWHADKKNAPYWVADKSR